MLTVILILFIIFIVAFASVAIYNLCSEIQKEDFDQKDVLKFEQLTRGGKDA